MHDDYQCIFWTLHGGILTYYENCIWSFSGSRSGQNVIRQRKGRNTLRSAEYPCTLHEDSGELARKGFYIHLRDLESELEDRFFFEDREKAGKFCDNLNKHIKYAISFDLKHL